MRQSLFLLWLVTQMALLQNANAELDLAELLKLEMSRGGRQIGDGSDNGDDGGFALGLVGALQKWANMLETKSKNIQDEVKSLQKTNSDLTSQLTDVQMDNLNLRNDIREANDLNMIVKESLAKTASETEEVKQEAEELKSTIEEQKAMIDNQKEIISANNKMIMELTNKFIGLNTDFAGLQGTTKAIIADTDNLKDAVDQRKSEVDMILDRMVDHETIMANLNMTLHAEADRAAERANQTLGMLNKSKTELDLLQMTQAEAVRHLESMITEQADKADATVDERMQTLEETLSSKMTDLLSNLNSTVEEVQKTSYKSISNLKDDVSIALQKLEVTSNEIINLNSFKKSARDNFQMIKEELQASAELITNEMARSIEESLEHVNSTIEHVTENVGQLRDNSSKMSEELMHVERQLKSLDERSTKLSGDLVSLKSHQQRSIESSTTLQTQLQGYEGKLEELMDDRKLLLTKVESLENDLQDINKSHDQSKDVQVNTMKGLERLGDSLATLKGDIMGSDLMGKMENITNRVEDVEAQIAPMSLKVDTIDSLSSKLDMVETEKNLLETLVRGMDGKVEQLKQDVEVIALTAEKRTVPMDSIDEWKTDLENEVDSIATSLTNTRNAMAQMISKIATLESTSGAENTNSSTSDEVLLQVSTLKTNVIGLGNYINSVNRELSNLSGKTKLSVETLSSKLEKLNVTLGQLETEMDTKLVAGGDTDPSSSSLRADVSSLASKLVSIKSSVFQLTDDVTNLKSEISNINTNVRTVSDDVLEFKTELNDVKEKTTSNTEDVTALKTNGLLPPQPQDEGRILELESNLTQVASLASNTLRDLNSLRPEVSLLGSDLGSIRSGMTQLTKVISAVSDPPRFSCGVTSDEIKVSGVIVYDDCTVNTDTMMNMGTGHATAPLAGDYLLSFSANMVSSDSQAVWCALYKQSPGDEGWQVLGMINNYQKNSGEEDDRDSGSLTVLTSLKKGDQVWVEWRGYGDSFLYSNPYKLISFSGFLISGTN